MQISLEWVNELVNLEKIELEDFITKLTLGGFEVEEILEVELGQKKNIALDVSATANRSDSLSIQGLALEIAALIDNVPKLSKYSTKTFPWLGQIRQLNTKELKNNNCSEFITIVIENLNCFNSPKWLQNKLFASGIIPQNNLSDFQNYIIIENGYPLEFYDFEKIVALTGTSEINFNLKLANEVAVFTANNDIEYEVNESLLILNANDKIISLAGIINSQESSYSTNTKSLLVEGSIFNAAKIRQQSRKLGLRTDRSSRYEKSLKNTNLLDALYRFIWLLRIANPKLKCKFHTIAQPAPPTDKIIELNYQNVKQILGPIKQIDSNLYDYISPQDISDALARLQFDIKYEESNQKWDITIPVLRTDDIVQEIDLIEEIGRIYGFNNFLTRLPIIKAIGSKDYNYQTRQKLTSCLINLGLNELIQYSLINSETYLRNEIELVNPLVKDYSTLRISLLPNLVIALEENLKKSNQILEGFEYGHAFSINSSNIIQETEYVAGIFGGFKTKSNWSDSANALDWFEAKGKIELLLKRLNLITYWKSYKPIKEKNLLHLYRSAEICLNNGKQLGIFGQISPILAKKLNISKEIYLFEFNFEAIKTEIQRNKLVVYQDSSSYPKIIKDLSFIIKKDIEFTTIQDLLFLNGSQFLTEVTLLDEYQGNLIPQNYTSLCLQLLFQSKVETLQTKKVETIITNLTNILIKKFDATIRT